MREPTFFLALTRNEHWHAEILHINCDSDFIMGSNYDDFTCDAGFMTEVAETSILHLMPMTFLLKFWCPHLQRRGVGIVWLVLPLFGIDITSVHYNMQKYNSPRHYPRHQNYYQCVHWTPRGLTKWQKKSTKENGNPIKFDRLTHLTNVLVQFVLI